VNKNINKNINKVLFLDIDTQEDFLNPESLTYVPDSVDIMPNLKKLTRYARENYHVFVTMDTHNKDNWVYPVKNSEFDVFPQHCIKGEKGWFKILETFLIGTERTVFEKNQISVFTNSNFEKQLNKFNPDLIVVYGVSTDFCVKEAVEGLIKRNYQVAIVTDAIAGINKQDSKNFLLRVEKLGVKLYTTSQILDILDKT